jgi:inhibitor of KinA
MEIVPIGDSALIVRLRDRFEDAPDRTLDTVLGAVEQLRTAAIPGVIELTPAYTSVSVFYDPSVVIEAAENRGAAFDWLATRIKGALAATGARGKTTQRHSRTVQIPICYDSEFALDIDDVARCAHMSPKQVISLHSAVEYRVACIGFVPGFAFLAGLAKELATPRRSVPRKQIPSGSVGIGGAQTGIYPLGSPGGWNLIGRTPLRLFDPKKNPPTLLRVGERVRFRQISRDEFDAWCVEQES